MKNISLIFFVLLYSAVAFAQAPSLFNYQGVARDLSGDPIIDKKISLRISILAGSATGTSSYEETHDVLTNNLGLFAIQIGDGMVQSGNFSLIAWGNNSHFLQIEMDESGGDNFQIIGTSQLMSVPYALHAKNGSQWVDVNNGIQYSDKVNIGDLGPSFLDYDLNIRRKIDGTLGLQVLNEEETGRSLLLLGQGNLGRYFYMAYTGSNWNAQFSAFRPSAGILYTGGDNGISVIAEKGDITFTTGGLESSFEKFIIKRNGRIGIGTSNPASQLQIADGDVYIEDINAGVIMKSPNGQCWRVQINNNGEMVPTMVTCPN